MFWYYLFFALDLTKINFAICWTRFQHVLRNELFLIVLLIILTFQVIANELYFKKILFLLSLVHISITEACHARLC